MRITILTALANLTRPILAVAVVMLLLVACSSSGDAERVEELEKAVAALAVPATTASPTQTAIPPSPQPTNTKLPDRINCAEVRGTDYRSPTEREWFIANCNPTPPPPPTPAPPEGMTATEAEAHASAFLRELVRTGREQGLDIVGVSFNCQAEQLISDGWLVECDALRIDGTVILGRTILVAPDGTANLFP